MAKEARTFPDTHDDVVRSLVYYFQHQRYTARSVEGTLYDHFRDATRGRKDLRIGYGYPREPEESLPPSLFLASLHHYAPTNAAYGGQRIMESFDALFVGVVGLEDDNTGLGSNQLLRDRLMNDTYYLVNGIEADSQVIDFYNFSGDTPVISSLSSIGIGWADAEALDPENPAEVDRYGFTLSFRAEVQTTR